MATKKAYAGVKGIIAALSVGHVCGLIADGTGRIIAVTPQFKKAFNYGRTGKNLDEIFEDPPSVSLFSKRKQIKLRLRNSHSVVTAKTFPSFLDHGFIPMVFENPDDKRQCPDLRSPGFARPTMDVADENNLERRIQLFRSAFENSTDAIVITGVDGRIVDINNAFTKIYDHTKDKVIGRSTAVIQSKHSTLEFYKQMWASLGEKGQWHGEIINKRKDGSEVPIWLSITPIYLDGTKIGYMGIESDISDKKDLEQQIIQTEKLATTGQLAAGIAHEIGTPLNIISGNAEFLLLDMNETDKGYQELSVIINQTKRMTHLMRQLLDFARPRKLSLQAVEVNGVLKEVLEFVKLQFSKSGIEISTTLPADLPMVYGDPAQIYQVFLNIIVNAVHAMPNGGELNVSTSIENRKSAEEKVVIRVEDAGEGIPPEHIDKVFTPFFTTKGPGKGTGLGLAVTKRIVQEHKGNIEIESEAGKGTTVTIRFNPFSRQE